LLKYISNYFLFPPPCYTKLMFWIPLSFFSAIIFASRRAYEKTLTKSFGNFSVGFLIQSFSILPTLLLFFFLPLPPDALHLSWQFWWPLLIIWFVLYPIQTHFLYRSLREGALSHVTPIMALLPVFNTLTSLVIIGELPTKLGFVGILFIVVGTYLLLYEGKHRIGEKYNRAVVYMIIATACTALGTTLDKVSILASTPVFYSFMNTIGASVVFLVLLHLYRQKDELQKVPALFLPLTLFGILQALSYTASMLAFSYGPTAYVLAIRSSGFLFATFIGIFLLKEKFSLRKGVSLMMFFIGILLLTVGA